MAILSSEEVKMTSLLEKAIAVIAPFRCITCSNYNNIVCSACVLKLPYITPPLCLLCGNATDNWQVCPTHGSSLDGVWAASEYAGVIADVIKQFKFDHARDAYKPLAESICRALPSFAPDWCVVAVPTKSAHIRQRGYDQAVLLAREVARLKKMPFTTALRRVRNRRQVGASRKTRLSQAQGAFEVVVPQAIIGRRVVVVDDVCTTGATLSAAAQVLKSAGAIEVWGAVAAWQPPKK